MTVNLYTPYAASLIHRPEFTGQMLMANQVLGNWLRETTILNSHNLIEKPGVTYGRKA